MTIKASTSLISLLIILAAGEAASALSPQTELEFKRAQRLFSHKHGLQARTILLQLADRRDANPEILCLLADTYLAEGNDVSDNALSTCEKLARRALKLDNQWGNAHKILSQVSNARGKFDLAVAQATTALSVKKPDLRALLQRSLAYQQLKKGEEALKDITTYTEIGDSSSDMFILKGSVLTSLDRSDLAIAAYQTALKKRFSDWTIYRIVECMEHQHQYEQAIKQVTVLIKLNSNDPEAMQVRGRLNAKAKHFQAAIDDYTQAIKLEPLSRFYIERAAVFKSMGNAQKAADDLTRAEKLDLERP